MGRDGYVGSKDGDITGNVKKKIVRSLNGGVLQQMVLSARNRFEALDRPG
jgi:hypothetical protein